MAMAQNSGTIFRNFLAVVQDETSSRQLLHIAMARNITVELLSGKVHTLAVQPEMTIKELKEEVKGRARGNVSRSTGCLLRLYLREARNLYHAMSKQL